MPKLDLKSIDPTELMPTPEIPESYGPRNQEDVSVYKFVKEALDGSKGKKYGNVADFIAELRATIPPQ